MGARFERTIGSNRLTSGVWDDYQTIGCGSGGYCSSPRVAVDAQGNALAVWFDWIPAGAWHRVCQLHAGGGLE